MFGTNGPSEYLRDIVRMWLDLFSSGVYIRPPFLTLLKLMDGIGKSR